MQVQMEYWIQRKTFLVTVLYICSTTNDNLILRMYFSTICSSCLLPEVYSFMHTTFALGSLRSVSKRECHLSLLTKHTTNPPFCISLYIYRIGQTLSMVGGRGTICKTSLSAMLADSVAVCRVSATLPTSLTLQCTSHTFPWRRLTALASWLDWLHPLNGPVDAGGSPAAVASGLDWLTRVWRWVWIWRWLTWLTWSPEMCHSRSRTCHNSICHGYAQKCCFQSTEFRDTQRSSVGFFLLFSDCHFIQ
jgi:hypothetical protein